MQRVNGTVKSFSPLHGYGFISGTDGENYFFHNDEWSVRVPPTEGLKVMFEPTKTPKGLRALNIRTKRDTTANDKK